MVLESPFEIANSKSTENLRMDVMLKTAADLIAVAQTKIECVNVADAQTLYQQSHGAVIVDVREAETAAKSKLNDSVNISRGLIEMKVPDIVGDPETVILTHCGGGGRASMAAATLKEMGYQNVYAITAKYEDIKKAFG